MSSIFDITSCVGLRAKGLDHPSTHSSTYIKFSKWTLSISLVFCSLSACETPQRSYLNREDVGGNVGVELGGQLEAGESSAGEVLDAGMEAGTEADMMVLAGQEMAGESAPPMGGMVETPAPMPPEECFTHEDYFVQKAWAEVLRPICLDCHNPQGAALTTDFVMQREEMQGAIEHNYEVFSHIAAFDQSGFPLVLLKPMNRLPHGGGALIQEGDESYQILLEMVERTRDPNPIECAPETVDEEPSIFEGVKMLEPQETLRRAALSLAGRLPTREEEDLVMEHGWGGVELCLDRILGSKGFEVRLKEIWNDILLTDKYLGGTEAIDLLATGSYPYIRWFMGGEGPAPISDLEYWSALDFSNDSLAREALEHIAFVVRENRPFGEIISSDYIAMNPFTARMYGVTDIAWEDDLNPEEYRPGRIPGIPHAGILTSPMFLNRYPTTETNRNRHRARIFFKLFLDLDVFKIAERPIDPTSTAHNPTMNDPQCSICHTVIDPVAGAFQHWNEAGSFVFREAWYGDMRAPGYGDTLLPFEERTESLRWLAEQATADAGFDRAIIRLMYKAFMGDDLMKSPTEGEYLEARIAAFEEQQNWVAQVGRGFRANGHNFKWLIKAIVRSPYFRASTVNDPETMTPERVAQLAHVGLDNPLTPEQLNRKLIAALGIRWRSNINWDDALINRNEYRLLYGGIDSDDVVERIRTPNGIFANIQRRMANEVACKVTAYDFTRPAEERLLFPWVEPSFVPEDGNGFPIPQAQERIRDNLKFLAWRLWGERLSDENEELTALEEVWTGAWRMGNAAIAEGRAVHQIAWQCMGRYHPASGEELPPELRLQADPNYVIRAWEATIAFMINDYAFLYE